MKIQCLIHRQGGTEVTFDQDDRWPAGRYHFQPETNAPGAPHVAVVDEELHQHRLLSMPDVYRLVLDKQAKAPTPESGAVVVPPKQPGASQDPPPPVSTGDTTPPAIAATRVTEIRDLSIKDLKGKVNTFSADELRAALAAEKARTDESPRKGWIDVVQAHLGVAG